MAAAIAASFLAGLLGSPHCLGMCGPFVASCAGSVRQSAAWLGGKTVTYAALGTVAGAFGATVPGPAWLKGLAAGLLVIWFAATLAGFAPEPKIRVPFVGAAASRVARRADPMGRFLFGAAVGLLPCGLVYGALGLAVASGNALGGAATMAAFGLGTAPALATFAFGAHRAITQHLWARRAVAAYVLVAGLWMVVQRSH